MPKIAKPILSLVPDRSKVENLREALGELEILEHELKRRRAESGIDYFVPNKAQLVALKSGARIIAMCAGNRSGKTENGAFWLSSHLTHQYPSCTCHGEWFPAHRRFSRPLKAVVVVTEFPILERTIEPKIMKLLPKKWIASVKRGNMGYLRKIIGIDGSTVDFLSNEMDSLAFESADWDMAWIDEPISQGRFTSIWRGLTDRQGLMFLTFTPLVEPWMKEDIIDAADGKRIDVVQAETYDNTEDVHGSPILSRQAVEEFEASIPEEERATRLRGQFFHLKGMVYKEWYPLVHERVWDDYRDPDPIVCVLDPHIRRPHHVIWAWVKRDDSIHIDRELLFEGTLSQLARAIMATEASANYRVLGRLIDPNMGRTPNVITGKTVIQELATGTPALRFGEANDDETAGILKIKSYLSFNKSLPISAMNTPRLFFHRLRCPKTIKSMKNLQYDSNWNTASRRDNTPKEKIKDLETDGADVLKYLLMSNPTWRGLMTNQQWFRAKAESNVEAFY